MTAQKPEQPGTNVKAKRPKPTTILGRRHMDATAPFPIIGIGASAGGLEALEEFLYHLPDDSGMAVIIIQHLDPKHKGMLPELLQRNTRMAVHEASNGMRVKPNNVYVIPSNTDLSILHETLHLLEPVAPHGLRLPIDFFFRALAEERREYSIGVILSGMGSDGTLGLRAIKEKGGLVLVQEPNSAKFDGMPRSVIDAGLADIIATSAELPGKIIEFLRHTTPIAQADEEPKSPEQKGALDKIIILLRTHTGHDFSLYKKSTLYRRVERRMAIHHLHKIDHYVRYLRENSQELTLLFKELLIGVTNFFRNPDAWDYMQEKVLPALLAEGPKDKVLRAWVIGCSTGEEAYSLAITFREVLEHVMPRGQVSLQIFATDLDPDAIDKARQGFYPPNIAADLSPDRLSRYFIKEPGGYRVGKTIREMVVFAPQNVIMDPPFTKLDILSCRNLLIYLDPVLQKKLLPLFHYCLNPGGILFLGSAETIGVYTDLFTPLDSKSRLYTRTDKSLRSPALEFPNRHDLIQPYSETTLQNLPTTLNLQHLADQLLLQKFSPAAVLVNAEGDILYISGRTGKYLEPAAGKANWNIHAMAREGLRQELALSLPKALRDRVSVTRRGIQVGSDGATQTVDLTLYGIDEPKELHGMAMIVFTDLPSPALQPQPSKARSKDPELAKLDQALQQAREELHITREEMQTQQEELMAANEELQSTNEELQSTNEELTTSKEEMQSLNEELQTVNTELQSKVDELSVVNSDMQNLLNSTDIATVFLNNKLHVRRFTSPATTIFKLIPSDIGRPLSDIVNVLDYPEMHNDAMEVLHNLLFSDKQIPTSDGRWFQVKIMPYRTLENVIDGVVMTLTDITKAKLLEDELRKRPAE